MKTNKKQQDGSSFCRSHPVLIANPTHDCYSILRKEQLGHGLVFGPTPTFHSNATPWPTGPRHTSGVLASNSTLQRSRETGSGFPIPGRSLLHRLDWQPGRRKFIESEAVAMQTGSCHADRKVCLLLLSRNIQVRHTMEAQWWKQCGLTTGPRAACGPQTDYLKPTSFLSVNLMLSVCYSR